MSREAVVVGAGPAGCSAALALLRRGWRVTILEQRTRWVGRVCGAFLNSEAVRHLNFLGLYEEAFRRGAVVTSASVTTSFGPAASVGTVQRASPGLALSREALEEILADAITARGGRMRFGARVINVQTNQEGWTVAFRSIAAGETESSFGAATGATGLQRIPADLVVIGDGRFSIGASDVRPARGWYGWNATFSGVRQRPGDLSLHFYPGGYVGALTFADGTTNVCGLAARNAEPHASWDAVFETALQQQPSLRAITADATRQTEWKGVGPLPFSGAMRPGRGPILAGDAAAVGDPFMGEGIGRALGAGPMLDRAFALAPSGAFDSQELDRIYRGLWMSAYSYRLRIGHWSRRVLDSRRFYRPVFRFLLRRQWPLRLLTPSFHSGFSGPFPTAGSRLTSPSNFVKVSDDNRP